MNKEEIREKVRMERIRDWIRDAIMLRRRTPEESLETMFDLIEFSYKLNKASK